MSCRTDLGHPSGLAGPYGPRGHFKTPSPFAWTDLTYLLHAAGITWKYYVAPGSQPDCADASMFCPPRPQRLSTPDIWNPLPGTHFQASERSTRMGNFTTFSRPEATSGTRGWAAFLLAAAASGLVLALGLAERRRTFAIASALGARRKQLAAFVWSEAVFVTLGGVALGTLGGWAISYVLVKILTGVFDPPPEHLFVPFLYLMALAVVIAAAVTAAAVGTVRATRRPAMQMVRDL